jgi:formylglycine-generating enzyme required for sulfatase activity
MRGSKGVTLAAMVWVCASGALADTFGTGDNEFTIDFVTISGDASSANGTNISHLAPGEPGHRTFIDPGDFRMGVFEITNDEWDQFSTNLGVPVTGNPADAYNTSWVWPGTDMPATAISWYEAAQFVNWLNTSNGHHPAYKFTGTQGTSDYTLGTWSAEEAYGGINRFRHKDSFYYLPTEHEWVKAASWNGTALQTYANASADDLVSGVPDPLKWNYNASGVRDSWDVGSGAEELNGTHDMMGNVWEWTENPWAVGDYGADAYRSFRGGSFASRAEDLRFFTMGLAEPSNETYLLGFRVASEIPEPSCMGLILCGALMFLKRSKIRASTCHHDSYG